MIANRTTTRNWQGSGSGFRTLAWVAPLNWISRTTHYPPGNPGEDAGSEVPGFLSKIPEVKLDWRPWCFRIEMNKLKVWFLGFQAGVVEILLIPRTHRNATEWSFKNLASAYPCIASTPHALRTALQPRVRAHGSSLAGNCYSCGNRARGGGGTHHLDRDPTAPAPVAAQEHGDAVELPLHELWYAGGVARVLCREREDLELADDLGQRDRHHRGDV